MFFLRSLLCLKFGFIEVICGPYISLEAALCLKTYFNSFGCSNINYSGNFISFSDMRFLFQLNSTLLALENMIIYIFLGTNIRLELPLLNARVRKVFLNKQEFKAYSVGLGLNHLTFPVKNLGIRREHYFRY